MNMGLFLVSVLRIVNMTLFLGYAHNRITSNVLYH